MSTICLHTALPFRLAWCVWACVCVSVHACVCVRERGKKKTASMNMWAHKFLTLCVSIYVYARALTLVGSYCLGKSVAAAVGAEQQRTARSDALKQQPVTRCLQRGGHTGGGSVWLRGKLKGFMLRKRSALAQRLVSCHVRRVAFQWHPHFTLNLLLLITET